MERKTTTWISQATNSEIAHNRTCLRIGNLKRESESLLIAAQNDNTVRTYYIEAKIDKMQQR